jgi:hypothetical protein
VECSRPSLAARGASHVETADGRKMRTRNHHIFRVLLGFVAPALFLAPTRAHAQAAPGPLARPSSQSHAEEAPSVRQEARPKPPEVPPRTTLAGTWKFNQDQSDDARQKVRAADGADVGGYPGGGNPGGGYPGGGYPGGGYPGGGYPRGPWGGGSPYPRGGGPNRGPQYGDRNMEENPKIQALMHPGGSLVIELKSPEIDVIDDQSRKLLLYTDGRQLPKATDDRREEVAAHWEGSRLVSDEKSPLGGKMSRVFELSPDGRQLDETLRIDSGRSGRPLTIRYVYDAATNSAIRSNEDSDPGRPQLKRHADEAGTPSH